MGQNAEYKFRMAQSLTSRIVRSLGQREMAKDLPDALLSKNRTEVLHHDETDYWDYKERLELENPLDVVRFAKDVLAFHNSKGGAIIVGVNDDFDAVGIPRSKVLDTVVLHGKLRRYVGNNVTLFQNSVPLARPDRVLWLIFIPRREGAPVPAASNGPQGGDGRLLIHKNEYYVRISDESRSCHEPSDYERLFAGASMDHLQAYIYDVDEPYFRLLAPHCERFVGRLNLLELVMEALESRHPVISLDGVGGVGKTTIAIQLVRHLYEQNRYLFIVSLSAKARVWQGYTSSRRAGFSGFTEFLQEIAHVLQRPTLPDVDELKADLISYMQGIEGLFLVDNVEDIDDPDILRFISREIPDPVKCIVTSRVDRGLGALTIPITEMLTDEAKQLLFDELQRQDYRGYLSELSDVEDLLHITQGLPLAIKWAAGLARSCGSLREVASRLRRSDIGKREFLNYCFGRMFDTLSGRARDVALLCPYLRGEWNSSSVCVALDISEGEAERAFLELKDRGIVFESTGEKEGALSLLPLTADFLAGKWHENSTLRTKVAKHLREALGSSDSEGLLLAVPKGERTPLVIKRTEELLKARDFKRAGRLVRLGLQWNSDRQLRFLEGQILYESGEVLEGISCMRIALRLEAGRGSIKPEERYFLGAALLRHGSSDEQLEGLDYIEDAATESQHITFDLAARYTSVAVALREFKAIDRILERNKSPLMAYTMTKALLPMLTQHRDLIEHCGEHLWPAFNMAAKSGHATADEQTNFRDALRTIKSVIGAEGSPD